jgi:phosphatidylglycerol---prolipoprotein diacylglyceryl transferase
MEWRRCSVATGKTSGLRLPLGWKRGSDVIALYIHNLNPVMLKITESLKLHWYGAAYVAGFLIGHWLLVRLARRGIGVLEEKEVGDFITYGAIFGVMLGGRLGYLLFYRFSDLVADPMLLFRIREGGMASHGGILGLFFFTLYYSLRHKKSWTGLGDNLVTVAPLGILFGRLANFINGELYGNPVPPEHPLAVKFPSEIQESPVVFEQAAALMPQGFQGNASDIIAALRDNAELRTQVAEHLTPRHPSQLYEGALEGLLLFAVLWWVRTRWPRAPHGTLTAIFFLLYAAVRMFVEHYYRVGDGVIMGMSRGFFYSTFMVGLGLAFALFAWKNRAERPFRDA